MPTRGDGFGAVTFRQRGTAPTTSQPPSLLAIGLTVFAAVLAALCAYSLLAWLILAATPDPTPEDLRREMQKWEGLWEQAMPAPPPPAAVSVAHEARRPRSSSPLDRPVGAPALPGLPGLVEAQRGRHDIACLSGRVSYRIPDGWRSSNRPCRATTQ